MDASSAMIFGELMGKHLLRTVDMVPKNCWQESVPNLMDQYKKIGVTEFGKIPVKPENWPYDLNELFIGAKLPEGWTKDNGGDLNVYILDKKQNIRATCFYKCTDKRAHITFHGRYQVRTGFGEDEEPEENKSTYPYWYQVEDNTTDRVVYKTRPTRELFDKLLRKDAENYLDTFFPEWKDVNAYWE